MYKASCMGLMVATLVAGGMVRAADEDSRWKAMEARIEALEKQNSELQKKVQVSESSQKQIKMDQSVQHAIDEAVSAKYRAGGSASTCFAYLAPDQPKLGHDLAVSAEALYWKPLEFARDYAARGPSDGASEINGNVKSLDLDWSLGGRLTFDYKLDDGWAASFVYTHFRADAEDSVDQSKLELYGTSYFPEVDDEFPDHAKAVGNLKYDVIDLEFGRKFKVSETLSARLFAGPRAMKFDQDYKIVYIEGGFDTVTQDTRTWGFGMRAGGEGEYHVVKNWSLYGGASASLLAARTVLKHQDLQDGDYDTNFRENLWHVIPAIQLSGGFAWEHRFNCNLNMQVKLGYEFTNFFNLNQYWNWISSNDNQGYWASSDVGFHGPTLKVKIDF